MAEQIISSSAVIKLPMLLYGSVQITKPEIEDLYAQTDMLNPIPSAPIGLVAVDAGTGDTVNLSWSSSASSFNIYKKVGAIYTKLNPNLYTLGTSYLAGGLVTDVPVDFVVRASNGLGQESADSNVATATPTLDTNAPRFTTPSYQVYINSILQPLAILESVDLGFGSDLSTASFNLPVDPRETAPGLDEPVEIFINGRKIFKGHTTIKNDSIDASGLQINYVCHSNITDLIQETLFSTDAHSINTVFNAADTTPETLAILRNPASAYDILTKLGVTGGPNEYPGYVDITDQTVLAAAELVLSRIGNYRLYHDMLTDATSVYRFGSLGFATRQFQFGKNIISYKIDESYIDVVKKVTVVGAVTKYRTKYAIGQVVAKKDPDGRMSLSFQISGTNLQDIQVFGWQKAKPTVTFDEEIQVCLDDFVGAGESSSEFRSGFKDSAFGWTNATGEVLNDSTYTSLYPVVTRIATHAPVRVGLGAKVVYTDSDHATVFLNEVPKIWYAVTKHGKVNRATVGQKKATFSSHDSYGNWTTQDVFGNGGTMAVEILLNYDFYTGTTEVEYTVDNPPPVVSTGSGEPAKSITDTQYEIVLNQVAIPLSGWSNSKFGNDPTYGSNNEFSVKTRMQVRALAELARASIPTISGTLTVVGDETIDLRASVSIKGQLLEISHVSHNFQNGYTTTISLTNEPFVKNTVFAPVFFGAAQPKQTESMHKSIYQDTRTKDYIQLKKDLASQKDNVDKQASSSGKYAILQD
jgi:hypothetical protein